MVMAGDKTSAFNRASEPHTMQSFVLSMSNAESDAAKYREPQQLIVPELQQQYTTPEANAMASGAPYRPESFDSFLPDAVASSITCEQE